MESDEVKDYPSDTKSTKSGSNRTCLSSVSGVTSKQSNTEIITPNTLNDEDIIQKYYKELRTSLKSKNWVSMYKNTVDCIMTKRPSVSFKDIAGNDYAKKIIQEAFVLPNLLPGYFTGKPKPWNKILLYGVSFDIKLHVIYYIAPWGRENNDVSSCSD